MGQQGRLFMLYEFEKTLFYSPFSFKKKGSASQKALFFAGLYLGDRLCSAQVHKRRRQGPYLALFIDRPPPRRPGRKTKAMSRQVGARR